MPEDGRAPFDDPVHYQLVRLVHPVDIQIEIIVDNIPRRCYEDRGHRQQVEPPRLQDINIAYTTRTKIRQHDAVIEQPLRQSDKNKIRPAYQSEKSAEQPDHIG